MLEFPRYGSTGANKVSGQRPGETQRILEDHATLRPLRTTSKQTQRLLEGHIMVPLWGQHAISNVGQLQ